MEFYKLLGELAAKKGWTLEKSQKCFFDRLERWLIKFKSELF